MKLRNGLDAYIENMNYKYKSFQIGGTMANKKKSSQSKYKKGASSYGNKSGSVVGSIYTYKKRKKPKRVGKTCKYFDKNKLTCSISKTFCKDADTCTSYVTNMQEVQIVKPQYPSVKKSQSINDVGITAIVLSDNRKCTNNNHTIIDLNATVRIAQKDGKVVNHIIPAAYCKICDTYFVLKKDYKIAKEHGTILCPIIDMTEQTISKKGITTLSTSESRIHQLGYNVKRGNGYTREQRQLILANILENTNISRHEIESCILRPLMQHKNQVNYSDAVLAWKQDLEFIKNYKIGDIPEVVIDKIIIGKRNGVK